MLAGLGAWVRAAESNAWPMRVAQQDDSGQVTSWEGLGPLLFGKSAADGAHLGGFRPLYVERTDATGRTTLATVLYPLFIYRADSERYQWSLLQLINRAGRQPGAPPRPDNMTENFDWWIFWFSRQTGSPETSYRALFPIGGTIKDRFATQELSWVLWPLYVHSRQRGAETTSTPWPFIRTTRGAEQGFAFWPIYGWRDRPGEFHREFYLWPLAWSQTIQPDEDAPRGTAPTRKVGFIPFYTGETGPGGRDETYLWPFFGYTDRTAPVAYRETRYLWPLLVQGRGPQRLVNRWAPFYTHSVSKGVDKTWVMWPLVRQAKWTEGKVAQTRTQFLYLLYYSDEQRSLTNPAAAPAERTHVWPLFSLWDNGAGRRQFQLLSPLDVFFPSNDNVRETWTPLFALYRYDQRAAAEKRWSLLWGALSWQERAGHKEFHLGPLFRVERTPEAGWRWFWFDFRPQSRKLPPPDSR
ncbi:MAG: hypothetical protein JSR48_01825 [Verrucomicrobia bacterium]|nr:hypothetical protein [Verrucomicrobiota bacterium]